MNVSCCCFNSKGDTDGHEQTIEEMYQVWKDGDRSDRTT